MSTNIKQLMFNQCLLQSREGVGIPIEVADDEHRPWWLESHVFQDGLQHRVGPRGCLLVVVGIGPAIYVVHQVSGVLCNWYSIKLHSPSAIELRHCLPLGFRGDWLGSTSLQHKDTTCWLFVFGI